MHVFEPVIKLVRSAEKELISSISVPCESSLWVSIEGLGEHAGRGDIGRGGGPPGTIYGGGLPKTCAQDFPAMLH